MHYLYYCNSTYQLINILNLHHVRKSLNYENIDNYSADLIMLNAYNNAREISETIKATNLFKDVRIIERVKIKGKLHLLKTIRDIIFPSLFLSRDYKYNDLENRYDCICTPKFNRFIAAVWQLNKKAKLDYIEDGLETYFGNIGYASMPKSYKILYKSFNYDRSFDDIENIYVNSKELYVGNSKANIRQIPKLTNEFINNLINKWSNYINIDDEDKNIYFLSQYLNYEDSKNSINYICCDLLNYKDSVIYCSHPRNKVDNTYGFEQAKNGQIWELKLNKIYDVNNTLLISAYSTACFTPKLLFNMEPYVVLTYNMINKLEINNWEAFNKMMNKFIELYNDKSKIIIPKTEEEFKDYLKETLGIINEKRK